jgi:hypothetical protein
MIGNSKHKGSPYYIEFCRKIILTTDQDLIKDGVQPIDDEFLQWFVKNPSCESVEVKKITYPSTKGFLEGKPLIIKNSYKIYIPKEVPNLTDEKGRPMTYWGGLAETNQENCCTPIGQIKRYVDCKGCDRKPRQETIEEIGKFAERKYLDRLNNFERCDFKDGVFDGAKCQQERSYSEEEVIDLLIEMNSWPTTFEGKEDITEWFNQFKKK